MILSPFLCNLYLTEWDAYLSDRGFCFVRFADDFLVFASDEKGARKALAHVKTGLKRLDLALNTDKTRLAPSGPQVTFLGRRLPTIQPSKAGWLHNLQKKTK
jgi:hypothetical protein